MHFPTYITYHSLWWTSCGPMIGTENSLNCTCFRHAGSIRHAGNHPPSINTSQISTQSPTHINFLIWTSNVRKRNLSWIVPSHMNESATPTDCVFVYLLLFYILATSKVISGWTATCDSLHSWWLYSATTQKDQGPAQWPDIPHGHIILIVC